MENKCKDCGIEITDDSMVYNQKSFCDECFDKGLHRDMNEHWDNFWEQELGPKKTGSKHVEGK